MIIHPELHVLLVTEENIGTGTPWPGFGAGMDHLRVTVTSAIPRDLEDVHAVITTNGSTGAPAVDRLLQFVRAGGAWLALVGLSDPPIPEAFGVQPGPVGPRSELRLLFTDRSNPLGARLPDAVYIDGCYQPLQVIADGVETVLYVDWHYNHSSVLTSRQYGDGHLACTTLQDFRPSMVRQTLYRLLRHFQKLAPAPDASLGVGILGYAPSVGKVHGLAAERTPGLHLMAACDLNPAQLRQAAEDFPGITTYATAAEMTEDPLVDLVIVATAPNSHAKLSMQMLAAEKHVLCEKPLALSRSEAEAMMEMAARHAKHLSCHQNRRYDPDFLAIKTAIADGLIGEPFYVETFVGGFNHPCGYWHSHAPVSGGTSFDWGAHYIDWLVGLLPYSIEAVIGTRHKRVWHDVTNGDQERIQIRYTNGQEAEFIHSDIAAVRKPKWYVLGTTGAILGNWQDIAAIDIDPVHYFSITDIPATEMMPDIILHQYRTGGDVELTTPVLPARNPLAFHFNLADHLLWGEPLAAPLADSIKVVSILEAAARSMAHGGRVEKIDAR
jgi:scyllo-inositol 2-dehydrogenase (NADP+)